MRRDRRQLADRRVRDPVAVGDVEVLVQEHRDDVRDALVAQLLVERRVSQGRTHYMGRQLAGWLWTSAS